MTCRHGTDAPAQSSPLKYFAASHFAFAASSKSGLGNSRRPTTAAGIAVQRTDRHGAAARSDLHAGISGLVLERIGRASGLARIEHQAEAIRIRRGWRVHARLVDQPDPLPSLGAVDRLVRVVGEDLQQVERAERVAGHLVPEPVVAAAPDQPGVAAEHRIEFGARVRLQIGAAIHVVEIVLHRRRQRRGTAAGLPRLVEHRAGPRRIAGAGHGQQAAQQQHIPGDAPIESRHDVSPSTRRL